MSSDAYTVLVRLSLNNQVSAGLLGLSGQFAKLQGQASALQARLNSIKALALTGLGMTAAGVFGLHMIDKALKPAEEYAHQLNIMNMAGVKQADIASSIGLAWKNTGDVITTTATSNLRMLNDMRIVFGDMHEAQIALPLVSRMQSVLMSSKEGKALASDKDFAFSVAKALDIIGAVKNKEEFMVEANAMAKTITAFQGRVTPKMFQSTFAYARQAKYAMNDEFKYQILPTLMMEYSQGTGGAGGGSRGVGPMVAALYRMTNQGYINKKSLPELQRVGLVAKGTELKTTTSGTTVGAMKDYQLAGQNPFLWVQQVLVPALQKTYGKNGQPLTREELQYHINQLFRGNQLAASLLTEFAVKPYAFQRDQKLIQQAMSPEQAFQRAMMNDPVLARESLAAQWENVQTALTVPIVSILIPALTTLATGLNSFAQVLQEYPMLAKVLSVSFLGLSLALTFGGIVLLLAAAFKGLALAMTILQVPLLVLGAPILGIAAAIGLVAYGAYKLWQVLKTISWDDIVIEFKKLFTVMISGITNVINSVKGLLGISVSAEDRVKALDGKKGSYNVYQNNPYGSNIINFSPKSAGSSSAVGKPQASNAHANTTIQVASNIHLDGRQIAKVVTDHQVRMATTSPNYSQGFDPNMSPTPMVLKGNIA